MTAVCALVPGSCRLVGGPSLTKRPVKSLVEALKKLGVKCSMEGKTTPPVTVEGGVFKGGKTEIAGNISSQFISALLLIAPLGQKEAQLRLTTELTSRPYVLMTLRCLRQFGVSIRTEFDKFVAAPQKYKPAKFKVEGDWSSASYFLAMGAVSDGVEVDNLSTSSLQGDRVMLDFLRKMGARVRVAGSSVTVSQDNLKAIRADLSDCIDLLPTMAVLAALADGTSEFIGIERARIKESNRVAAVREGLEKLGVTVTEDKNRLTVAGLATSQPKDEDEDEEEENEEEKPEAAEPEPENVVIDSKDDHRIAMAFSIFGVARGGVTLSDAECVSKTFPDYWDALKGIGGQVKKDE
jgi:3-phosphoshikimate 1-carboxyvinyltransferase